jgi:DNA-binding MarR family transcriptional regulator
MGSEESEIGGVEGGATIELDDVVHQRVRLGVLTIANEARRVEFRFLLDSLALTGGNLSQHLRVLADAGLIRIQKGTEGRRPRTWVLITPRGRRALLQEIAALKAIVARVETGTDPAARRADRLAVRPGVSPA